MSRQFKKVLLGYDTSDVDMKIKLSKLDFDNRVKELEENLAAAMSENDLLNDEYKKLNEEKNIYDEYNKEIEIILRHAFERASLGVYNTKTALDKDISEKVVELENLENKNQDINNSINKLLDKLHGITKQQ